MKRGQFVVVVVSHVLGLGVVAPPDGGRLKR